MGSTVVSKYLSEHMTALKLLSYQFVTASLRLIAEVLGLGLVGVGAREHHAPYLRTASIAAHI
jgi:hypothetical protein